METVSTMGTGTLGRELDLHALVSELEDEYGTTVGANFTSDSIVTLRLEEAAWRTPSTEWGHFRFGGSF
jgi:transcription initiation factor TFIID TATA-box-binding protein